MASNIDKKLVEKEVGSEITDESDGDNRAGSTGIIFEFDNGEEWLVFPSYDDAEYAATDSVKDDLDSDPEMFSGDWLNNFIYVTDTDRRIIAGEEADNLADNMSEEELIEEEGFEDEYEELTEEEDDLLVKKENTPAEEKRLEEIEKEKNEIITTSRDSFISSKYDEIYDSLKDPVDYFVEEQGIYTKEELFEQSFISIDTTEAAEDAIQTDGVAHFLSSYDGEEVELDNGNVMYRTN